MPNEAPCTLYKVPKDFLRMDSQTKKNYRHLSNTRASYKRLQELVCAISPFHDTVLNALKRWPYLTYR